jgi:hypothetical protein
MIDLFLSYARADRGWVSKLAESISSDGWRIWWDREIPLGAQFQRAIVDALEMARCVSVVWSPEALRSDWVIAEASSGRDRNVLVPILKDRVKPPVPFNLIQSADMSDWQGENDHPGLNTLRKQYVALLGQPDMLPLAEAARLINQFVKLRRIDVADIEGGVVSSSGVKAFRAGAIDRMGVVYCHATGPYEGQVFYVRKGISIFFHKDHGGPAGKLGLPVSNEELVDGSGFPTSYFENGLIEWSPDSWEAQAFVLTQSGREKLGRARKV